MHGYFSFGCECCCWMLLVYKNPYPIQLYPIQHPHFIILCVYICIDTYEQLCSQSFSLVSPFLESIYHYYVVMIFFIGHYAHRSRKNTSHVVSKRRQVMQGRQVSAVEQQISPQCYRNGENHGTNIGLDWLSWASWNIMGKSYGKNVSGWWFGTFFIFPYIGFLIIPIDFHIFQRGSNHQPGVENKGR